MSLIWHDTPESTHVWSQMCAEVQSPVQQSAAFTQ
jgi:hypothetical protein